MKETLKISIMKFCWCLSTHLFIAAGPATAECFVKIFYDKKTWHPNNLHNFITYQEGYCIIIAISRLGSVTCIACCWLPVNDIFNSYHSKKKLKYTQHQKFNQALINYGKVALWMMCLLWTFYQRRDGGEGDVKWWNRSQNFPWAEYIRLRI